MTQLSTNGHANGHSDSPVVLITGAGGWLGGILSSALLKDPATPSPRFILCDIVEPKPPKGLASDSVICRRADLSQASAIEDLFTTEFGAPDVVYCLHGIMSRGAEDNFDLGLKINIDSTRCMLEQARKCGKGQAGQVIKFIFTSSVAVFGGPLPHEVMPSTQASPEGSYGVGKLIAEILVSEYSRRGFVDGRVVRLPTIVVRPGAPSPATSAFVSGIIREPLHGQRAICPIGDSFDDPSLDALEVWVASPENVIDNLVIASHVPAERFAKHSRVVNLPGFTVTVKQELEALRDVAGQDVLDLVDYQKDPTNARIVGSWPRAFNNEYAFGLGFKLHPGGFRACVESFKADVEAGRA